MQNSDKKPEILAPAGSFESLKCAIANGADAVYLGMRHFSARAKAANFTRDELIEAVKYAHFFGVKVYVTFNVIYKPNEYDDVINDMKFCHDIGVDALILQDFAIISAIKSTMPDIVLHLSTQAGVHNLYGALVAEKLGFKRIILSREATFEDIRQIKENTNLEIEIFVQGALCVSFSGNCYFSSLASGYSGNRGKCMQLCRKIYDFDGEKAYWLSPKDVCLAKSLAKIVEAGVCSLKIEGRMRRPEYAGEAVNCYKTLLEGKEYDFSRLKKIYNRGNYTDLYLSNTKNYVIYPQTQNHIGLNVGKVHSVSKKVAKLPLTLKKGDGIKFLRKGKECGSAYISRDGVVTTFAGDVKAGDDVCITTDKSLNEEVLSKRLTIPFDLYSVVENSSITVIVKSGENEVMKKIENLLPAQSAPLSKEDIVRCFEKTTDLNLTLKNANVSISDSVFIPKSELNNLRRDVSNALCDKIINSNLPERSSALYNDIFADIKYFQCSDKCTILQTDSIEVANACADLCDYIAFFPRNWNTITEKDLLSIRKPFLLSMPNVIRGKDAEIVKKVLGFSVVKNVIVNNIGGIELAKDKNVLLGPLMNIIRNDFCSSKILSPECKNSSKDNFVYYYGSFPIMTFCHCPLMSRYKKCFDCKECYSKILTDEKNNDFTLQSYKIDNCYCRLLNCVPINLTGVDVKTQKKFVDLVGMEQKLCYNIMEKICNNTKISGGTLAFYNKNLE